jgi:hypothetical protein
LDGDGRGEMKQIHKITKDFVTWAMSGGDGQEDEGRGQDQVGADGGASAGGRQNGHTTKR